jgi:hypothetical protein
MRKQNGYKNVRIPMNSFAVAIKQDGTVDRRFQALPPLGIYVISYRRQIIRVGECSSGSRRFRSGFCGRLRIMRRGKDCKNYAAYSWRDNYRGKSLTVDYFKLPEAFGNAALRRALEAELTFQIRLANRRWPRDMSEIHFLERHRKKKLVVKQLRRILAHYRLRYDEGT